jgi:transposase
MIQISSQTHIFISTEPLDFRNGFNGTAAACRRHLNKNPLEGGLFVFINRSRTMIRFYIFDNHGEWVASKRIVQGRFNWWKNGHIPEEIMPEHLYILSRGGDPSMLGLPPPWKRIT